VKYKRQMRLVDEGVKVVNRIARGSISITANYTVFLSRVMCNQDAVFDLDCGVMSLEYFRYVNDISLHIM